MRVYKGEWPAVFAQTVILIYSTKFIFKLYNLFTRLYLYSYCWLVFIHIKLFTEQILNTQHIHNYLCFDIEICCNYFLSFISLICKYKKEIRYIMLWLSSDSNTIWFLFYRRLWSDKIWVKFYLRFKVFF